MPIGHSRQRVLADSVLYFPAGHFAQSDSALLPAVVENFPGAQPEHTVDAAASLYCAGPQYLHASSDVALGKDENLPCAQDAHEVLSVS